MLVNVLVYYDDIPLLVIFQDSIGLFACYLNLQFYGIDSRKAVAILQFLRL